MRRHVLALAGAVALAAPMLATGTAQAATPRAVPDAPLISAVNPGPVPGSVDLYWIPPNGGDPTSYEISWHTVDPVGNWTNPVTSAGADTYELVQGLVSAQKYIFRVRGVNAEGPGPWSPDSPTVQAAGIQPPSDLRATPGDGVVNLTWLAPTVKPTLYNVQYRLDATGSDWAPAIPLQTGNAYYTVRGLPAGSYYFRVTAVNTNPDAESTPVDTTAPVSPGVAPGPPPAVQAVPGDGRVDLTWQAPTPSTDVTYQVQYQVSGTSSWLPATPLNAATTSTTITGLTNGTPYFFQVRSVRGSALSAWTQTPSAVAPNGTWAVPAAPTSVTGSAGNGLAFLYWSVPTGNPATNYDVRYSLNNSTWSDPIRTNSTALNYTLTGLANGVPYYIQVRTINGPQASGWTQMPGVVVPYGAPNPPTGVTGVPGNNQVTVSWTPPVTSGVAVTGYRVQYSTNNGGSWTTAVDLNVPTTSVVVSGLTNGVGYAFRVQAKSPSGDSAWSAASPTVVPPGGPSAPTNAFAVAGNSSASVGWTASAGTPNFPILGYRATASPGGQTCTTTATSTTLAPTTCNVTGLTNGQAYTFTVVAISNAGVSAPSAPSTPVTPVGGPYPPTAVTAVAGDRSATVSWTPAASSAGGPVTSYRATSSPDGRFCTVAAPATSCTVTGLTNGQPYTFTVVAISATGTSASSAASGPVTPFTTQVTIKITDSSRNGGKVVIRGTTAGVDPGDTLQVLTRVTAKGQFQPTGEVTVRSDGTFRWTGSSPRKTWVRVTNGDVVSNTVIVPAR